MKCHKAHIDAPGTLYYYKRYRERRKIFYDDLNRDNFLERLRVVLTQTGSTPIATVMRRFLRSLLCYWGTLDLGMTTVEPAKKIKLARPTVS